MRAFIYNDLQWRSPSLEVGGQSTTGATAV